MPSITTSSPISAAPRGRRPITGATVVIDGNRSSGSERMYSTPWALALAELGVPPGDG